MPKFLEDKLRSEYGNNPHAIFGTMNKIGAMRGNKETAKGRQMERKHEADMAKEKAPHQIREMRIEVHRGPKNEVTGHTVHHHMMPKAAGNSPSGAFMENTEHSFPFDAKGQSSTHGDMMEHIGEHLGILGHAAKDVADEEKAEGDEE